MIRLGLYEHYKKKQYEVVGEAIHSETGEILVLYKALYAIPDIQEGTIWARPKTMFLENVLVDGQIIPRFSFVPSDIPNDLIA